MNPVIRPASREDAARAGEICDAACRKIAEQHAFPPDFHRPDVPVRLVQPVTLMTMGPYAEPAGAFLPSVLY